LIFGGVGLNRKERLAPVGMIVAGLGLVLGMILGAILVAVLHHTS
jgi:cytochrome c-type biogenesis protein CcmE